MNHTATPSASIQPYIATPWHRIAAFVIDLQILSMCCFLIVISFAYTFYKFPFISIFSGYLIFVFYFGLLNSRLNQGQTLGKHILKIQVIHLNQQFLTPSRSLIRAAIVSAPLCLYSLATLIESPVMGLAINIMLTLIFISSAYLLIFNQQNHRSLHDQLCHSLVINKDAPPAALTPNNPIHRYILVFVLGLSLWAIQALFNPLTTLQQNPQFNLDQIRPQLPKIYKIQQQVEPIEIKNDLADKVLHQVVYYEIQVRSSAGLVSPFLMQDFITALKYNYPELAKQNIIYYKFYTQFQFGPIFMQEQSNFQSGNDEEGLYFVQIN